ncbi:hypothetical protein BCEP27_30495 [Burkholderia cepacia]
MAAIRVANLCVLLMLHGGLLSLSAIPMQKMRAA